MCKQGEDTLELVCNQIVNTLNIPVDGRYCLECHEFAKNAVKFFIFIGLYLTIFHLVYILMELY